MPNPLEDHIKAVEDALTPREGESVLDFANRRQRSGVVHPYTCGKNSDHVLVATPDGWACPECDYRQPYRGGAPPV